MICNWGWYYCRLNMICSGLVSMMRGVVRNRCMHWSLDNRCYRCLVISLLWGIIMSIWGVWYRVDRCNSIRHSA